jgi:hypothetical protein
MRPGVQAALILREASAQIPEAILDTRPAGPAAHRDPMTTEAITG